MLIFPEVFSSHFKGKFKLKKKTTTTTTSALSIFFLLVPLSEVLSGGHQHYQLESDKVDSLNLTWKWNGDTEMHKFHALNLNKSANDTLWVLITPGIHFLLFAKATFQESL